MELRLYITESEVNRLNKALTDERIENITLRRDFDLLSPVITLKIEDIGYNYIHIPDLNRFYFINEKKSINNSMVQFNCECDLLASYKDEILSSHAVYKRKLRAGDTLPADLEFSINTESTTYESDKGFEGSSMILTTVGEGA